MGYTKITIKGITWMSGVRVVTRVFAFLKTIITARILTPSQFGVFGIATIVLALTELVTETGVNVFLLQEDESIDEYLDSAWIVSIVRGIVIAGVILILSTLIANFFNAPDATFPIIVMSIVPFLRGFINPAVILLQKQLTFHKEFWYRSSVFFVESISSVIAVILFPHPVSLVWGLVIGALYEVVYSFVAIPIKPKVRFNKSQFQHIISRGKWVTAAGVFDYLFHNVDNLAIGKILGTASLGLYDMAYTISMTPISEVTDVISKVTFPIYVKIGGDRIRLRMAYLKTVLLIAGITIPAGIIGFLFPEFVIALLLGDKWLPVVPVFKLLIIFGVIRALSNSSSAIFMSLKMQSISALLSFLSFVILAILIVPMVQMYGLQGAATAVFITTLCIVPGVIYYLRKVFTARV